MYLPDIRPLNRTAPEADVKSGRAVFQLSGKSKPLAMKPPAVAHREGGQGLIVQAEMLDGRPVYGVMLRRVDTSEVVRVGTLAD